MPEFFSAWAMHGVNRGIMISVYWNVMLFVGSLAALPFDHRRILGLNPWIKPIKFEISVIIFLLTVGLLLSVLGEAGVSDWLRVRMAWGFGIAMIFENSIIALQSARGVRSHMNFTSVFNGAAFATMGFFILLNTILLIVMFVLFLKTPSVRPAAEIWGIRLGLALIIAGSLEGIRMVSNGGHTVGAADGGPGLPFINWSTQHGDLRIAHFFALHALQLLWFVGWWLGRTQLGPNVAVAATWIVGSLYAGGVWLLFAQAMAEKPLLPF
jgi:hypothetical protein